MKVTLFNSVQLSHTFTNVLYVLVIIVHIHQCFFAGTSVEIMCFVPSKRMKIKIWYLNSRVWSQEGNAYVEKATVMLLWLRMPEPSFMNAMLSTISIISARETLMIFKQLCLWSQASKKWESPTFADHNVSCISLKSISVLFVSVDSRL